MLKLRLNLLQNTVNHAHNLKKKINKNLISILKIANKWLTKMKENPNMYYYEPMHYKCKYGIHDLFSTHYYHHNFVFMN